MADIVFNIALLAASAGRAMWANLGLASSLSWWLTLFPKLQVLKSVVCSVAVNVVNVLVVVQRPSKVFGHNKAVFQHRVLAGYATTKKLVVARIKQYGDVALFTCAPDLFCNRVSGAASLAPVLRLVPVVSQKRGNLVHVGAKLLRYLVARKPRTMHLQHLFKRGIQRSAAPASASYLNAPRDEHSSHCFVVVPKWLPKGGEARSGSVVLNHLSDYFVGDKSLRWHGQIVANIR